MLQSHLPYLHLTAYYTALSECNLPEFTGSLLRGTFGHALKELFCMKQDKCSACQEPGTCTYSGVFDRENVHWKNIGLQFTPNPYIVLPSERSAFLSGSTLKFGLVIFGEYIKLVPEWIQILYRMGEMGFGAGQNRFLLQTVVHETFLEEIYCAGEGLFLENMKAATISHYVENRLSGNVPELCRFSFVTPARFIENKESITSLTPELLLRSMVRRYTLMNQLYGTFDPADTKADMQFQLREIFSEYADWDRFSNRKHRKMKQGGLFGEYFVREANLSFLQLLYSMEILHIGKSPSFGLGKVKVDF